MFYDSAYAPAGDAVARVNAAYAEANGYSYNFVTQVSRFHGLEHSRCPSWYKVSFMLQELPKCEWFLWVDADALIVNKNFQLDSLVQPDKDLLLSSDSGGYCAGVLFIRNTAWSLELLRTWLFCGEVGDDAPFSMPRKNRVGDQGALVALIKSFPRIAGRVSHIPTELIQNPECPYCSDAFIMHYWGNCLGPDYALIRKAADDYEREGRYTPGVKCP
jgi:hypothetical protein